MFNGCVVANYTSRYITGDKNPSFSFAEDNDLKSKWIYFVNRKDWQQRKHSVIRIKYFESKFVKIGKKCKLQWHLHPVSTIHLKIYGKDLLLRTPSLPRKSSVKRNIWR